MFWGAPVGCWLILLQVGEVSSAWGSGDQLLRPWLCAWPRLENPRGLTQGQLLPLQVSSPQLQLLHQWSSGGLNQGPEQHVVTGGGEHWNRMDLRSLSTLGWTRIADSLDPGTC